MLAGRGVAYASSDLTRATVDAAGLVTALAPGAMRITATSEARTAAPDLDVRPAPPARVTLAGVDVPLPPVFVAGPDGTPRRIAREPDR